ncbi:hypothetical protein FACS1894132_13410 [Clostridia bacterium]|nr:hypothetical protein FACS1894132_13410 [Clostridia bacterium]
MRANSFCLKTEAYTKSKRKAKGSVLYTVVSVMIVLFVFVMVTMAIAKSANDRAYNDYSRSQALYTARSIAEIVSVKLNTQGDELGAKGSLGVGNAMKLSVSALEPGMGTIVNPNDWAEKNVILIEGVAEDKAGTDNFIHGSKELIYKIRVAVKYGTNGQVAEYQKYSAPKRAQTTSAKAKGGLVSYGTFGGNQIFDNAKIFKASVVSMAINRSFAGYEVGGVLATSPTLNGYMASDEYLKHGKLNLDYDHYDSDTYSIRNITYYYETPSFYSKSLMFANNMTYGMYLGYGQTVQVYGHVLSNIQPGLFGPQETKQGATDTPHKFSTNNISDKSYNNLPIFFVAGTLGWYDSNSNNFPGISNIRIVAGQMVTQAGNLSDTKYVTANADIYCFEDYDTHNTNHTPRNYSGYNPPGTLSNYTIGLSQFMVKENGDTDAGHYGEQYRYSLLDWTGELKSGGTNTEPLAKTGGNFYSLGRLSISRPMTFAGEVVVEDGLEITFPALGDASAINITMQKGLFTNPAKCDFSNSKGSKINGIAYTAGESNFDYIKKVNNAVSVATATTEAEYKADVDAKVKIAFTAIYKENGRSMSLPYESAANNNFAVVQAMLRMDDSIIIDDFFDTTSTAGLPLKYITSADGSVIKYDSSGISATSDKSTVSLATGDREYYRPKSDPYDGYYDLLAKEGITTAFTPVELLGNGAHQKVTVTGNATVYGEGILEIIPPDPRLGGDANAKSKIFVNLVNVTLSESLIINTNEGHTDVVLYVPAKGETVDGHSVASNGDLKFINNGYGIFSRILYNADLSSETITDGIKSVNPESKFFPSIYFFMNGSGQIIGSGNPQFHGFYNCAYATVTIGQTHNLNTKIQYELTDKYDEVTRTRLYSNDMMVIGNGAFGEIKMAGNNATIGFYYIDPDNGGDIPDPNDANRPLVPAEGFDYAY